MRSAGGQLRFVLSKGIDEAAQRGSWTCHRHFAALAQNVERDLDIPPRFQAASVE